MLKNRFFLLAVAFAIVAVGVAAFAPATGLNTIAFAQSGSGDVVGGGSGSDDGGAGVAPGASASDILGAIGDDSDLSASAFAGVTISPAESGTSVFLSNVFLCWGPNPDQCSTIPTTGDFQVLATVPETGAFIILHAGRIRVVFP